MCALRSLFHLSTHRFSQITPRPLSYSLCSSVVNFLGKGHFAESAMEFLTQRHEEHKEIMEIVNKGAFVLFVSLWLIFWARVILRRRPWNF